MQVYIVFVYMKLYVWFVVLQNANYTLVIFIPSIIHAHLQHLLSALKYISFDEIRVDKNSTKINMQDCFSCRVKLVWSIKNNYVFHHTYLCINNPYIANIVVHNVLVIHLHNTAE